ncbi:MAG: pyocin activator protein PrtN [Desulfurellales bacterium]|nr:MAG: pyocin activator protein PrtN [Desulfurellales bacterium]
MDSDTVLLKDVCEKYLGCTYATAVRRHRMGTLGVPAFRLTDSQKAPLLVKLPDLQSLADKRYKNAKECVDRLAEV